MCVWRSKKLLLVGLCAVLQAYSEEVILRFKRWKGKENGLESHEQNKQKQIRAVDLRLAFNRLMIRTLIADNADWRIVFCALLAVTIC